MAEVLVSSIVITICPSAFSVNTKGGLEPPSDQGQSQPLFGAVASSAASELRTFVLGFDAG